MGRSAAKGSGSTTRGRPKYRVLNVEVDKIRPEDGLGRKRDRAGHHDLCRSIEQFGVLTPITVRSAPDGSGEYLLIKGQGRTLACRLLGIAKIPAVVVDSEFAETEKVQQFLVENVARLRMRAIDRALLIAHARRQGEETADVARRFGVSASTIRRLEAQMSGATSGEVLALREHDLSLSLHAVISRHVSSSERPAVIAAIGPTGMRAAELEELLVALGWKALTKLGARYHAKRLRLLRWACESLAAIPNGHPKERIRQLSLRLPSELPMEQGPTKAVAL
jgi:ParB/RepB/Spo0J family partition protein